MSHMYVMETLTKIFKVTRNSTVTIVIIVTIAKDKTSYHTNIGNCLYINYQLDALIIIYS